MSPSLSGGRPDGARSGPEEHAHSEAEAEPEGPQRRFKGWPHRRLNREAEVNAEQEWREQIREDARQRMRRQLQRRAAAGHSLFSEAQVGILHQQLRERRAA